MILNALSFDINNFAEITVSTTALFQTYNKANISVSGIILKAYCRFKVYSTKPQRPKIYFHKITFALPHHKLVNEESIKKYFGSYQYLFT